MMDIAGLSCFTSEHGGKLAVLRLAPELIVSFLSNPKPQRLQVTKNCLPEDATIVESSWGIAGLTVAVVLRSEAFDVVPPGGSIPVLPDVELTSLDALPASFT